MNAKETEEGMRNEELKRLWDSMTLEEKAHQMHQVVGNFYLDDSVITGPMRETGFSEESIAQAGSVLGVLGANKLKEIQKNYMAKHPHHIPLLFMLDVINGFRTIFPIPLAQGAAFEPELSKRCAAAAAKEAAASGIHVTFAPMTDLVRDARWGRVMESTGEDPYLNCLYARAMVEGFQGENLTDPEHIAACVKHFAGYGAATAGRDYNTVELSDHTLREFYLPSYQAGIEAGAAMVMTSFNTLEGVPATGNVKLMRKILREEMGFDGVLISDWAAIEEMIYHGYCADRREAALRAVQAGVDIDMMTGVYAEHLCRLVREGEIDEAIIDEASWRILELKNKLGLFEDPYRGADEEREREVILCSEHLSLAAEAAEKSFVLLKNQDILPLDKKKKNALIGPYVENRGMLGAWSFIGKEEEVPTIRETAGQWLREDETLYCQGCPVLGNDVILEGFTEQAGKKSAGPTSEEQERMLREAEEAAKAADTVTLFLGEHRLQSGEATSKASIKIPEVQQELFRRVCQVNPNVAVVLFTGRPLDLRDISEKAKAVLVVWMPGTEGAQAIMRVLTGDTNPGGKLPMSFPYCVGQTPVHYNEYSTGRPHVKGKDKDRFRSKYLDIPNEPLYPFGYGLSYTKFEISPVVLSSQEITAGESLQASVRVKNIGERAGTEVVQLYIRDLAASVVRPVRELKGFQKVNLKPGEEREIVFQITEQELKFYSANRVWECEPGEFEAMVGADSMTQNSARFLLS